MSGGQWRRPVEQQDSGQASGSEPGPVIDALARALQIPASGQRGLTVERERIAGRSNIYVIASPVPVEGRRRWIVKQPEPTWSQDDVSNPLDAREEFQALHRLDAHFADLGLPYRVPEPVAFLPEVGAVAMEYVEGVTVKELLTYGSLPRAPLLLEGLSESGVFLRHLHALEALPEVEVDLKEQAERVLEVAEDKLWPIGLDLPDPVRRVLLACPRARASSPQVRLHGDFGPANMLLARDGCTVGLDPTLEAVGVPEEDLVRFVALTSGIIRLAPELLVPHVGDLRRQLENRLLGAYYQTSSWPPLFEVKFLHQLCRRWCRLRELAAQNEAGPRLAVKLRIIAAQMRLLMRESALRLTSALEA